MRAHRFAAWLAAASAAAFVFGACTDEPPADPIADGRDRLRARDFLGAAKSLEFALALEPEGSERFTMARLFYVQAIARTDADRALRDALELLRSGAVKDNDFAAVTEAFRDARAYEQAFEALLASVETHPTSAVLDSEWDKTAQAASQNADQGQLEGLKGLGYVSGVNGERTGRPRPKLETPPEASPQAESEADGGD